MVDTNWVLQEECPKEFIEKHADIHPVLLQLLWNRGVRDDDEIKLYIDSDYDTYVHSPFEFEHMQEATDLVFKTLEEGKVITVHGDYDADGVCGTTLLLSCLRELCRRMNYDEKKLTYYIPHREKEGYGFSPETARRLVENEKPGLVITVDCGISNKEAVGIMKEHGCETIICDHHTLPAELPDAILIHPLVEDEPYPNKFLCGTGVGFKLACGLFESARKRGVDLPVGYEKWFLDLVAIATVTDVMKLRVENRVLEKYGLLVL